MLRSCPPAEFVLLQTVEIDDRSKRPCVISRLGGISRVAKMKCGFCHLTGNAKTVTVAKKGTKS